MGRGRWEDSKYEGRVSTKVEPSTHVLLHDFPEISGVELLHDRVLVKEGGRRQRRRQRESEREPVM